MRTHTSVHTRGREGNSAHHRYSLGCATRVPQLANGQVHECAIRYHDDTLQIFMNNTQKPVLQVKARNSSGSFCADRGDVSANH